MPNQLQPLVDEINTCAAFQDPELKQQAVDFINLLVNPNQVVLQRNLRLVDDLTPDQEACLVTALRRALKLNNNTVKGNAAEALRNLPDVAGSAVPDLVGLLDPATEAGVRLRAAVAVAEIGPADADCLPQLITHLTDPDPDIQKPVIVAISKLGSEAAAAFEPLKAIFPADDEAVNEALISAFGELGRRAAPIAPNLAHYLQPGNSNPIRRATARSLEQLGIIPDEAIPHLVAGLQPEEEYDLRTAFLGALQQSTLASDQFVAQLAPFADDESLGPDIIKLLVRINSQAGVAVLAHMLLAGDAGVAAQLQHMAPGNDWAVKADIILQAIEKESLPAQDYLDISFPLIQAMLPPPGNLALEKQIGDLCQALIAGALDYQDDARLIAVIGNLLSQGTRLGPEGAKLQIDHYMQTHQVEPETLFPLREAAGDTSFLRADIIKLQGEIEELNSYLRQHLDRLHAQGDQTFQQAIKQFNDIFWMNRIIFGFGLTFGALCGIYFFYSLFLDNLDTLKSLISGLGTLGGIGSAFALLFYRPQKQGQEAINNLSKSNVILSGFTFEMAHIGEGLSKLQTNNSLTFEQFQSTSLLIRDAYTHALQNLEKVHLEIPNDTL